MDAAVWQSDEVVAAYLSGVRGAIPLAAAQIDTMLRLIGATGLPVRRVLDLGCGDGVLAAALLGRFPEARATLVDFSEPMLAAARTRFAARCDAVRIVAADYSDPAWTSQVAADAPFDAVVSGFSVHHQPDDRKRRIYRECFGLLVPGGVFLNLEHVASGSAWAARANDENFVDHLAAHALRTGDPRSRDEVARAYYFREDKAANILAPVEEQCSWLRAIGFAEVDCFFRQFELALFGGRVPGAESIPAGTPGALPDGIRVVPIALGHVEAFAAAVDAVARERRWLAGVEGFPLEATREFVRENIAKKHPQFVALDAGRVVGWCDIVPLVHQPGFNHNGRLGMGVVATDRGRGLGRALVTAALAAAPEAGFRRVELEAYASNHAALSLYRKTGFVEEGVKRGVRELDGATDDLVCMAWRAD